MIQLSLGVGGMEKSSSLHLIQYFCSKLRWRVQYDEHTQAHYDVSLTWPQSVLLHLRCDGFRYGNIWLGARGICTAGRRSVGFVSHRKWLLPWRPTIASYIIKNWLPVVVVVVLMMIIYNNNNNQTFWILRVKWRNYITYISFEI